jgi:antirestriction protein ArdC
MASQKIYDMITERVVDKIEDALKAVENGDAAIAPWHRPWFQAGMPVNLVSKKHYRGMNIFMLSMLGYASPYFVTYNQAKKLGGKVKKGEKGCPVVFWKWVEASKDKDGKQLDKPKKIPFLRYYTVFNVDQTEGIDESKIPEIPTREFNPIEDGDRIIDEMPNAPTFEEKEARAFYRPSMDTLNMPRRELFDGDNEYYSTRFHEMIHATGHTSRLNRNEVMDGNLFASHDYSTEELVAEMGAVFLCNEIGIESTFDNSVAYLKNWLGRLKDDTKMLITAAGRAQKAVDYILDNDPAKDAKDAKDAKKENDENDDNE